MTIIINDLKINHPAYLYGQEGQEHYRASATDCNDNDYFIIWTIKDEFYDTDGKLQLPENENDCCDWDTFTIIR